jgi:hypothetical protein
MATELKQKTKPQMTLDDLGITDKQEEKKAALEIFQNSLLPFLRAEEDGTLEVIRDYNKILMYLITWEEGFKKELESALYDNQEVITDKHFELGGQKKSPTIGNWIKYFIKNRGSGYFNNVELSNFITDSSNGKLLEEQERKFVQQALRVYRNVKFFVEVAKKKARAQAVEIIPVDDYFQSEGKTAQVTGPPKTQSEREVEKLKQDAEQYQAGTLERMAVEEEISQKERIEELRIEANKHDEGSLERQAIEEEIKKLESNCS